MATENLEGIKAGDIVVLKSGSPKMTVTDLVNQEAQVIWFPTTDAISPAKETIPLLALKKYKTPSL